MEAWFLRQWQRNGPWQILLRPLSWIYALLAGARRVCYRTGLLKRERVGVPVIVVGNITVGGTGKTPAVLALAQYLARSGRCCGIISRGYSRRSGDKKTRRGKAVATQVAPVSDEPTVKSDEAQLLATRSGVPVYISADRAAAARALLRNHPAVDVLICDDGLQHYALERDLEICVIDGARGFGNGRLLPAGGLREPLPRLGQVDALLINGEAEKAPLRLGGVTRQVATYPMTLGNESLVRVCDGKTLSIEQGLAEFSSKDILAIAGTGNPARFFAHLARLGFALTGSRAFADHHPFVAAELRPCDAEIILMTEKDAVKCRVFADDRMWFMRVDALLPDAFGEFVLKRLSDLKR